MVLFPESGPPELADALGLAEVRPELSVFINCPFDADYEPLLSTVVFTTVCSGFIPRSALETGTVAQPRMQRICSALLSSRYSIHDLSRCRGEGEERLARFNMPLELGIAMAKKFLATDEHDWLVLVPEGHEYVRFVSDLAGYDPKQHVETPESLVPPLMSWLCTRPNAVASLTPKDVLGALPKFLAAKEQLDVEWSNDPPWSRLVAQARYAVP